MIKRFSRTAFIPFGCDAVTDSYRVRPAAMQDMKAIFELIESSARLASGT